MPERDEFEAEFELPHGNASNFFFQPSGCAVARWDGEVGSSYQQCQTQSQRTPFTESYWKLQRGAIMLC